MNVIKIPKDEVAVESILKIKKKVRSVVSL